MSCYSDIQEQKRNMKKERKKKRLFFPDFLAKLAKGNVSDQKPKLDKGGENSPVFRDLL